MEIEEEPHIRTNPQRRSRFLMEIVRLVESKFLSVAEKILEVLEGNCDFRAFEAKLKKELDSLGCEILKEVLETLDRKYRESEERKRNWTIVRNKDPKSILTPFGTLEFERTYYRHKQSRRAAAAALSVVSTDGSGSTESKVATSLPADLSISSILFAVPSFTKFSSVTKNTLFASSPITSATFATTPAPKSAFPGMNISKDKLNPSRQLVNSSFQMRSYLLPCQL